ncbi:MAG TPA: aldehyde dehydrogenase (NADP(+)) [Verrucomicrobiae bacterium]|jgi:alpha-ketoglutaric semialdehyde dehydrogenase|nr:aldehyde dehydrogenase (NADP(+)) [Verrucomicrobiae bacterium]
MELEGLSLVGAKRGLRVGKPFAANNPANNERLPGDFHPATAQDVEFAVRLAAEAFSVFSQWNGVKRASLMNRIAELLEANARAIVERGNLETALTPARLQGELARTCFQLRFYGEAAVTGLCSGARIDHADPNRKPLPKPDVRSLLRPVGPVVVFGASNFPLAYSVAGGDTASALAAGCPVIVKAHPAHPGLSEMVGILVRQAAREAGAPEGIFSLLFDDSYETGVELVKHPLVKSIGFTGSRRGGRALMDLAATRPEPIPVFAEMSSINPVFILPEILKQKPVELAAGLHSSVTMGVGQFCTNPGLVFVQSGDTANHFLQELGKLMAATAPGIMLTEGICAAYGTGVNKMSETPGVRQIARADVAGAQAGASLFATEAKTFFCSHGLMDEVFGPSTLVVECSSREEMFAAVQQLEGQLTATIHATPGELATYHGLVTLLETKAGRLVLNAFPTGVEVCHAMTHGGPYPATADGRSTSVGTRAIERFLRPVSYQNFPDAALPDELKEANPLGIWRLVDGRLKRD